MATRAPKRLLSVHFPHLEVSENAEVHRAFRVVHRAVVASLCGSNGHATGITTMISIYFNGPKGTTKGFQ
jgi:hypothetical protein